MKELIKCKKYYLRREKELQLIESKKIEAEEKLIKIKAATYRDYERIVRDLTELEPIGLLNNYEQRDFFKYHIDHIVSIRFGYLNNIPAEQIASIENLQMLPMKENMDKGHGCYCVIVACKHLKAMHYMKKKSA